MWHIGYKRYTPIFKKICKRHFSINPISKRLIDNPNIGWETFFRLCVLRFPSNYVVTHQRFIQIACQYNIWVRVCKLKKTQDVPHSVLSSSIQMALGLNLRCPWINWIAWHQTHGIILLDITNLWMFEWIKSLLNSSIWLSFITYDSIK